ncbi:MAG: Cu(I)/Ag(I) efflux system membrane protein CusA/SilA [Myxococcota bacterium]|jgi:Cu(I)/Ag(I) efflux system membrane protein CusA/SilA
MSRLIRVVLEQRFVVVLGLSVVLATGVLMAPFGWDLGGIEANPVPVDAIPDIGEAQQVVATEWPGRSPEDIEDQITYPLTVALQSVPGVRTTRSVSMFGLSMVNVIMTDDVDFYWVRARILEALAGLGKDALPAGVVPKLGPDATALGQVYWYTLEGRAPDGTVTAGWSLDELRAIQEFTVAPALAASEGIAEIASIGGYVREYQVDVDPDRLRHYGVALADVTRAVGASNRDVGARTVEQNGMEYVVRGLGALRSLEDLQQVVVRATDGVPLTLGDVATIQMGPALRRGALDKDGAEAVGGVAVVRFGSNPRAGITALKTSIAQLAPGLPSKTLQDGTVSRVTVVPFYDRTTLIDETLETLESALIDQLLITVLVVMLMLMHLRASLLVSLLLPISVLLTFTLMKGFGVDANVVALAGIAIAIGTMVDVGIVVVENVLQHIALETPESNRIETVQRATSEIAGAVLTSVATTIISFLPVFALGGPEGKLFSPLAWTKTLALSAAVFVAVVVLPALVAIVFPKIANVRARPLQWTTGSRWTRWIFALVIAVIAGWLLADHWKPLGQGEEPLKQFVFVALLVGCLLGLIAVFRWGYERLLRAFLTHRLVFLLLPTAILFFGLTGWLGADTTLSWLPDSATHGARARMPGLKEGFLPDLDEGDFLVMPSTMPHASLGTTLAAMQTIDRRIAALPEVVHAVGKLGRAESALDPAPVSMIETLVTLKPEWSTLADGTRVRNWRPEFRSRSDIWDAIAAAAELPELTPAPPLQPIRTRILMLQSGIRGDMGVRIQGPNLDAVQAFGVAVERVLNGLPEVRAPQAERVVGKPYLEITPDRPAIARYGLRLEDVQRVIEVAVGGVAQTRTYGEGNGREGYAVRVRYPRDRRLNPEALGQLMLTASLGKGRSTQIPLAMVADIQVTQGPQVIKSEDASKTLYVSFAGARNPRTDQTYALTEVIEAATAALDGAIEAGDLVVPTGVRWMMAGDFEQKARSDAALSVLVPLALLLIVILLQLQFRSFAVTLMVFSGTAVAIGGGFLMLWAWGQPGFLDVDLLGHNLRDVFQVQPVEVTVAVWVGFIALIGIATDDGVLMATYLQQRFRSDPPTTRAEVIEAVVDAGRRRIRPCLMTTATTLLALLPVLTSTGKGADVMLPMAIPLFGGMLFELVTLFVVPVLFASWQLLWLRDSNTALPQLTAHSATAGPVPLE